MAQGPRRETAAAGSRAVRARYGPGAYEYLTMRHLGGPRRRRRSPYPPIADLRALVKSSWLCVVGACTFIADNYAPPPRHNFVIAQNVCCTQLRAAAAARGGRAAHDCTSCICTLACRVFEHNCTHIVMTLGRVCLYDYRAYLRAAAAADRVDGGELAPDPPHDRVAAGAVAGVLAEDDGGPRGLGVHLAR